MKHVTLFKHFNETLQQQENYLKQIVARSERENYSSIFLKDAGNNWIQIFFFLNNTSYTPARLRAKIGENQ